MAEFKPGDLVVLKSGGPVMTVDSIDDLASLGIACVWFAGAKRETAYFRAESIEPAPKTLRSSWRRINFMGR
jgi:uncharacterized protein YodC (DUF2158 family)